MKLALGVEYDGSAYHGWQIQDGVPTVQNVVELALSKIASSNIKVFCAGRTDAGVHAIGQVLHFETCTYRSNRAWLLGVNSNLPPDVVVNWVVPVIDSFHARFSAISRSYRYIIYNHLVRSALFMERVYHYKRFLDIKKMICAGQYLLGEHDFSAFSSGHSNSHSAIRKIYYFKIKREGHYLIIDITANSFIYRMVRNIIGSLIEVGIGNKSVTWIYELLFTKTRSLPIFTVPAKGLYLFSVDYPSYFFIPMLHN